MMDWRRGNLSLILLSIVIGVLVVSSFLKPKRKLLSTGREVARVEGDKKNGKIKISCPFKITAFQKWCRIGLVFRFSETIKWYEYNSSLGLQFNNYRLSIADRQGKCLFSERRSFMDFASLFKTAYSGKRFLGRYTATHRGEVAILDFIPPHPGRYKLDFDLAANEDFSEPGHTRMTSFQELVLWVREGVEPLRGPSPGQGQEYPHKRIDLMKVRDIMTHPIIAEDEAVLVTEIVKDMAEQRIGSVVITSENKPEGIITERDIVSKVVLRNKRASETKSREIMSSPLITLEPDAPVEEACEFVAKGGIKRVPVIENGSLVGIVSVRNILTKKPGCAKRFYPHPEVRVLASRCKKALCLAVSCFSFFRAKRREFEREEKKVRDIMTHPIITEDEDASVAKIAADMDKQGIGSVVITTKGKPAGIITERDIALKVLLTDKEANGVKAKEIMASPLVTVKPEVSADEVCKLAAKKGIKRVPVVENGSLVGIVSIQDLLRRKPECVREFYS